MRSLRVIVVVFFAALCVASAALGKEGVHATLTTPLPLDAAAGTKLHVAWKLASRDGSPFGGGDVFVRLLSAGGAPAETAYVNGSGTFAADVVVPKGGVGDVQIGIRGWTSGPDGTHESDLLFPITNDPLPGAAPATSSLDAGGGPNTWLIVVVIAAALALGLATAAGMRRRHTPARTAS